MLKYYVLTIIAILLCFSYTFIYYRRFNISVRNAKKKLFKISPARFSLYILIISLLTGFSTAIYEVNTSKREGIPAENFIVENYYLNGGLPNSQIAYVFNDYNSYFAGVYLDDGKIILCITEGPPTSLIEHLNRTNVNYVYVKHSYSDLLSLEQLIINSASDFDVAMTIGVSEIINKVSINTADAEIFIEKYQSYIDEDMLEIIESDGPVEQ